MLLTLVFILFILYVIRHTLDMVKKSISLKVILYPGIPIPILGHLYKFIFSKDVPRLFKVLSEEAKHKNGYREVRVGSKLCIYAFEVLKGIANEAIKNKHGVCLLWFGPKPLIFVSDAEVAKYLFSSPVCLEKADAYKILHIGFGNGSFFAPVNIWRRRRKVMMPAFSQARINKFLLQVFVPQAEDMIKKLSPMVGAGRFQIRPFIDAYSAATVYETVLGKKLVKEPNSDKSFVKTLDEVFKILADRVVQPWLHNDIIYKSLPIYKAVGEKIDALKEVIQKRIIEVRSEIKSKNIIGNDAEADPSYVESFLETLIITSGGDKGFTNKELLEELLVLMIASVDTTAVSTTFMCLVLAKYPEIQERVHKELDEVFEDSTRPVELADLPKLQYLEAVFKETLRLYPPGTFVARQNVDNITLPSGVTLPKGYDIVFDIMSINQNPLYWGEDANEFKPERWLTGNQNQLTANMSFSYGPRNCPGRKYAFTSAKVMLSTLLRRYRFVPDTDTSKDIKVYFKVILHPAGGGKIVMEDRRANKVEKLT